MNSEQKQQIRRTFAMVSRFAPTAASLFYSRLFEIAPETQALFRYAPGSPGMAQQGAKLMQALGLAVASLDNAEQLTSVLEALARRHVAYGVEPGHYDLVGAALLWTLEQGLGSAFTDEVRSAWATLYAELAATMVRAAYGVEPLEALEPTRTA